MSVVLGQQVWMGEYSLAAGRPQLVRAAASVDDSPSQPVHPDQQPVEIRINHCKRNRSNMAL
jgi:hypothetical protein